MVPALKGQHFRCKFYDVYLITTYLKKKIHQKSPFKKNHCLGQFICSLTDTDKRLLYQKKCCTLANQTNKKFKMCTTL